MNNAKEEKQLLARLSAIHLRRERKLVGRFFMFPKISEVGKRGWFVHVVRHDKDRLITFQFRFRERTRDMLLSNGADFELTAERQYCNPEGWDEITEKQFQDTWRAFKQAISDSKP